MQHRTARRGQLLGLVITQRSQQPRRWHETRVGREHAGHVGPDLEPPCLQPRRHVRGARVRAAATEQDGLARTIAGDEALRQDDAVGAQQPLLQRRIGIMAARRAQVVAAVLGTTALQARQQLAGVLPVDIQAAAPEPGGAHAGRHEFAERHDPDADPNADLAHETDSRDELFEFMKRLVDELRAVDAEICGERQVAVTDCLQHRSRVTVHRFVERLRQQVRNTAQRGMHDDRLEAGLQPAAYQRFDGLPALEAGNARATELHDHERAFRDRLGRAQRVTCFEIRLARHTVFCIPQKKTRQEKPCGFVSSVRTLS